MSQYLPPSADPYTAKLEEILYAAIVELSYVQSAENCKSGLCASAKGEEIVKLGMSVLNVPDLSLEDAI